MNQAHACFITDFVDCPCYHVYTQGREIADFGYTRINDHGQLLLHGKTIDLEKKNVVIFVHGDDLTYNSFFYYITAGQNKKRVDLHNGWWQQAFVNGSLFYFHSCSGYNIIKRDSALIQFFQTSVSHNNSPQIVRPHSSLTKYFLEQYLLIIQRALSETSQPDIFVSNLKDYLSDFLKQLQANNEIDEAYLYSFIEVLGGNARSLSLVK